MPFVAFVDSVIMRNLSFNPDAWLACPGTYHMAFLMGVIAPEVKEQ